MKLSIILIINKTFKNIFFHINIYKNKIVIKNKINIEAFSHVLMKNDIKGCSKIIKERKIIYYLVNIDKYKYLAFRKMVSDNEGEI